MRASASMSRKDNTTALLHYTIDFIGGFLGVYPVLFVAKTFASAQTANLVSMMVALSDLDLAKVALRILGFIVFCLGIILATWLPKHTKNCDLKRMALVAAFIDSIVLVLLPEETAPLLGVLPNFFTMAFIWSCYTGAYGFNSATIFITNNTKMMISAWTEIYLNHDDSFRLKFEFYGLSILLYALGVLCCAVLAKIVGKYASLFVLFPIIFGWIIHERLLKMH